MERLIKLFTELVLPKQCVGCKTEGTDLCETCMTMIMPVTVFRCPFCDVITTSGQTCDRHKECALDGALHAGYYHDPILRNAIHLFKYASVENFEKILGNLITRTCDKYQTMLPKKGVVVAVPLFKFRERKRGYNQAGLLAPYAARALGLLYEPEVLKRKLTIFSILANSPQAELDKDDASRSYALKNAYYVTEPCKIRGQTVLLVDDVLTSGATLEVAAQALKKAGATHVFCLVLAR